MNGNNRREKKSYGGEIYLFMRKNYFGKNRAQHMRQFDCVDCEHFLPRVTFLRTVQINKVTKKLIKYVSQTSS